MNDKSKLIQKMKTLRRKEQKVQFENLISTYKGLVLIHPEQSNYWYMLGILLLKVGRNKDGLAALATAKRLGSILALKQIVKILKKYEQVNSVSAQKALHSLGLEGVSDV